MCGRYHLGFEWKERLSTVSGYHGFEEGDFFPGSTAPVLLKRLGRWTLSYMRWGFRLGEDSRLVFNARAESVEVRPLFGDSFQNRRCAVPASWFYEWNASKEKFEFYRKDRAPFCFAGIWRQEEEQAVFVLLTAEADAAMLPVHDRMPLILKNGEPAAWCESRERSRVILGETPEELERRSDYEQMTMVFDDHTK